MLGSRALFAFQAAETDTLSDGSRVPTSDAQLGALMVWETQSATIALFKLFEEFCKALSKQPSGRGRRR